MPAARSDVSCFSVVIDGEHVLTGARGNAVETWVLRGGVPDTYSRPKLSFIVTRIASNLYRTNHTGAPDQEGFASAALSGWLRSH